MGDSPPQKQVPTATAAALSVCQESIQRSGGMLRRGTGQRRPEEMPAPLPLGHISCFKGCKQIRDSHGRENLREALK